MTIYMNSKKNKRISLYSKSCVLFSMVFLFISRFVDGFSEWYAINLYPLFVNILGRLFSSLPFSGLELLLGVSFIAFIYISLKILFQTIVKSPLRKKFIAKSCRRCLCFFCSLFILSVLTSSINYNRDYFVEPVSMVSQDSEQQELSRLCLMLIKDLSTINAQILDRNDHISYHDIENIKFDSITAMKNLGDKYSTLAGYYPKPKSAYFSNIMSSLGIAGIYSPFTIEAIYNKNLPDYMIPFTVCHELAHLKGFMREDEANFIAYLACRNSSSLSFQYSATVNALTYSLDALYQSSSSEDFSAIYELIPDGIKNKLYNDHDFYNHHSSTTISSIAEALNNQYLKINNQTDGNKSYGKMVELLSVEYANAISVDIFL